MYLALVIFIGLASVNGPPHLSQVRADQQLFTAVSSGDSLAYSDQLIEVGGIEQERKLLKQQYDIESLIDKVVEFSKLKQPINQFVATTASPKIFDSSKFSTISMD